MSDEPTLYETVKALVEKFDHLNVAIAAASFLKPGWGLLRDADGERARVWDEGFTAGFYDREMFSDVTESRDACEGRTPNPYKETP